MAMYTLTSYMFEIRL